MEKKRRHAELQKKRMEHKRRKMNANNLINQLDIDVWTISLGFCLVETALCGLYGKWIPLETSVVHDETISDVAIRYFAYLFIMVCFIWIIWLYLIATFEMIRDRTYQKIFLMANYVQIGKTNIDSYYDDYVIQYTNILLNNHQTSSNNQATNNGKRHHEMDDNDTDINPKTNNSNLSAFANYSNIEQGISNLSESYNRQISYLLFPKKLPFAKSNDDIEGGQTHNSSKGTTITSRFSSNGSSLEDTSSTDIDSSSPLPSSYQSRDTTGTGATTGTHDMFATQSSFHRLGFWYRVLFKSGFKYKNMMDRFVVFMDGILGWSVGWCIASGIFLRYETRYRLIYALIATVICIIMEILRNYYIHRHINKWYDKSKQRRRLYKQTMDDLDAKRTAIDIEYYRDTIDITDHDELSKKKQKFDEMKKTIDTRRQHLIIAASNILPEEKEVDVNENDIEIINDDDSKIDNNKDQSPSHTPNAEEQDLIQLNNANNHNKIEIVDEQSEINSNVSISIKSTHNLSKQNTFDRVKSIYDGAQLQPLLPDKKKSVGKSIPLITNLAQAKSMRSKSFEIAESDLSSINNND